MQIKHPIHRLSRSGSLFVLLLMFVLPGMAQASALERIFAPKAERWAFWDSSNAGATQKIDHSQWSTLLGRYVDQGEDGINRVRYSRVSETDRQRLQEYITALERTPIRGFARTEQLAYWINLYNALTVEVILRHYPVSSIRDIDISPGFFADGPWGKKLLTIENQQVSLNDIEHRILRPLWQDARLHYALNCASIGCPNLSTTAYDTASMNRQLDQAAAAYINNPRGVTLKEGRLSLSSIYSWFQDDFGASESAVIDHLKQYASAGLKESLSDNARIEGYGYDWSLNDMP